ILLQWSKYQMRMRRLNGRREYAMLLFSHDLSECFGNKCLFEPIELYGIISHACADVRFQKWIWPNQPTVAPRTARITVQPCAMGCQGHMNADCVAHGRTVYMIVIFCIV